MVSFNSFWMIWICLVFLLKSWWILFTSAFTMSDAHVFTTVNACYSGYFTSCSCSKWLTVANGQTAITGIPSAPPTAVRLGFWVYLFPFPASVDFWGLGHHLVCLEIAWNSLGFSEYWKGCISCCAGISRVDANKKHCFINHPWWCCSAPAHSENYINIWCHGKDLC